MPSGLQLRALRVENLRGFHNSRLAITEKVVLVGENNAGKTSILRLLDFLFHADEESLAGEKALSQSDLDFLEPRRETRGKARRLTLEIAVTDGRRQRRFGCIAGVCSLRFTLSRGRGRLNLGPATRGEGATRDADAAAMLRELRADYEFVYVPAGRGLDGPTFDSIFQAGLRAWIDPLMVTQGQQGRRREYRQVLGVQTAADRAARTLVDRYVTGAGLSGVSLAREVRPAVRVDIDQSLSWVVEHAGLQIVTGAHDDRGVAPAEAGSGLQALLLIALSRNRPRSAKALILVVEEPESHLHPPVQRSIARQLLAATEPAHLMVTSHSPQVVSETSYPHLVLVKNHNFYHPDPQADAQRAAINTLLLEDRAAELLFARSVLLVEGEGDRRLFEALRRRLAVHLGDGLGDRLFVTEVGGCARFGAWLRLLRSYGNEGDRPIEWVAMVDGDATTEITEALRAGGLTVPQPFLDAASAMRAATWDAALREPSAAVVNREAERNNLRVVVLPIDLEWELLSRASAEQIDKIRGLLNDVTGTTDAEELAKRLGSKVGDGRARSGGAKAPWLRQEIGRAAVHDDLAPTLQDVLMRWLKPVAGEPAARQAIDAL